MKKRSKTEVEIRNILSEIFLNSLKGGTEIKALNLIVNFCNKISPGATSAIYLEDSVDNKTKSERVEFDYRQLSNDVHLKRLFAFSPGSSVILKNRYAKYQALISRKTKAYLKVISRINKGIEGLADNLQDKLKVGVMLFNGGLFFECHEFLEEVWLKEKGMEKAFLKGLIHACVAFYHLEYENIKGAVKYLKRASAALKEFQPNFLGIDVRRFLPDVDKVLDALEGSNAKLAPVDAPKIKLID